MAAINKLFEQQLKTLGNWSSDAYQSYICNKSQLSNCEKFCTIFFFN